MKVKEDVHSADSLIDTIETILLATLKKHLVDTGYTDSDRMVIEGGSAEICVF